MRIQAGARTPRAAPFLTVSHLSRPPRGGDETGFPLQQEQGCAETWDKAEILGNAR